MYGNQKNFPIHEMYEFVANYLDRFLFFSKITPPLTSFYFFCLSVVIIIIITIVNRDVVEAENIRLDRWTVVIKPDQAEKDAQKKQLQIEANSSNTNEDSSRIFVMNNYFGLGIDADLNLDFHMAREENPAKFNSRYKSNLSFFF